MGTEIQFRSDYLFPEGGYILGMGSILNIKGDYFSYNSSPNKQLADYLALQSDWGVVAKDIKDAISETVKSDDRKPN